MVQSKLDKTINYIEDNKIAAEDENYPSFSYEVFLENNERTLALGQAKYSFIKKNIIYFPIYLIVDDHVNSCVGIYEIYESQLSQKSIFDEDGDVDPEKLGNPLYFSYFNDLLRTIDNSKITHEEEIDEKIATLLTDKAVITKEEQSPSSQSPSSDPPIEEKYKASNSIVWVEKFLKDNNYKIKDNEGGGECLFAAIRDAYKTIKKDYTVLQLREIVAQKATQEQLDNYKSLYNVTFGPIDKLKNDRSIIIVENKQVIELHKLSKDRDEQQELKEKNQQLIKDAKSILAQITELQEDLLELEYLQKLKDINNLDDFKEYIKTCDFWGESWAISILEEFLNIKLILLSPNEYNKSIQEKTGFDKVIFCGDIIHPEILKNKVFNPSAYIILDYNGSHFKLITYKNLGIFTFSQLPDKIKILIKKCNLTDEGSYNLIPELSEYQIPNLSGGKKTKRKKYYRKKTRKLII